MELRSHRSSSKSRASVDKNVSLENHVGQTTVTKSHNSTIKTTIVSPDNENVTNFNHFYEYHSTIPSQMKLENIVTKTYCTTSDYSSEDGENHVSSSDTWEQNTKNQSIENVRRSVSRSTGSVSAIDYYRAAGDYWNKYPKTDYTYSLHSRDRTEIAPGVLAMPNMSRKSLHSYDSSSEYNISHNKQTNTDIIDRDEVDYISRSAFKNHNSANLRNRKSNWLFSNNHLEDNKYYYSSKSTYVQKRTFIMRIITTITSFFLNIFSYIGNTIYGIYKIQNTILIWFGKKIHQATTRVMYWDTWLLQSTNVKRKFRWLLALCLIPLLVFAGWWLTYRLGSLLSDTYKILPGSFFFLTRYDKSNDINFDYYENNENSIDIDSLNGDFNGEQPRIEETIVRIREKSMLEPPTAEQIAAKLSFDQLQDIAKAIKLDFNNDKDYMDVIMANLLNHPNMKDVINNYNKLTIEATRSKELNKDMGDNILQNYQLVINDLAKEISKLKLELQDLRSESLQNNLRLNHQFKRCCRSSTIKMEYYVTKIIKDLLGAPGYLSTPKDISDWLHATFVAKHDLEMHLANLTQHLIYNYEDMIRDNEKLIMDRVVAEISRELDFRITNIQTQMKNKGNVGEFRLDALTDEHVKRIVSDSIALYDADKTGLVDYALESAGGHILSTRCTESYQSHTAVLSIFGIPLWYPSNTPRTVITPGMTPGECWAFQNFPGFLLIKLSAPIRINMLSYEHINKKIVSNIDSAPKDFSVYGFRNESDKDPVLLGMYTYDNEGVPLQYFAVKDNQQTFDIVELRIHSNHGNPNYTCLYRFRVHGSLSTESR